MVSHSTLRNEYNNTYKQGVTFYVTQNVTPYCIHKIKIKNIFIQVPHLTLKTTECILYKFVFVFPN